MIDLNFKDFGPVAYNHGAFLFLRSRTMTEKYTAKHKLNLATFQIAVIVSGLIGIGSGSFVVFLIAMAIFLGVSVHTGAIRS